MIEINDERFYTRDEVAELFKVTKMTLLRWEKKGLLKRIRIPGTRRVYYREEDIKELLLKHRE